MGTSDYQMRAIVDAIIRLGRELEHLRELEKPKERPFNPTPPPIKPWPGDANPFTPPQQNETDFLAPAMGGTD